MRNIKYNDYRRFFALIMLFTFILGVSGCGNLSKSYKISKVTPKNGSFSISHKSATAGTKITISSVKANSGYKIDAVSVKTSKNKNVTTKKSGNSWTFTMPEDNVSVSVVFTRNTTTTKATTTQPTKPKTEPTTTTATDDNVLQNNRIPFSEAIKDDNQKALSGSNIVEIAQSQIGYHGGRCFKENGEWYLDFSSKDLVSYNSGKKPAKWTKYTYFSYGEATGRIKGYKNDTDQENWCAHFVTWCARKAGLSESKVRSSSTASAQYINKVPNDGKKENYDKINAGDLVFLSSDGTKEKINHVGIVTSFINKYDPVTKTGEVRMTTIEGNYGNVVRERQEEVIYRNGRSQQLASDGRYVVGFNNCQ